jgi:hypothetical protein
MSFSFDNNCESPQSFIHAIPQDSPVSPILFSIIMSAILDANNPIKLQTSTACVNDINKIHVDINTSEIVPNLYDSFLFKAIRAAIIGLSFASDKSEVIHFSMAILRNSKFPEHLTLNDKTLLRRIDPSYQIKLFGVIVDNTLNFIVHVQHTSSKGM